MATLQRRSPVAFDARPVKTETRQDWTVVLEYSDQGQGPYLVDLSHFSKWDLQDSDLSQFKPWNVAIPETPGTCAFQNGVLINRMNRTQVSIWHLTPEAAAIPQEAGYTETTDSTVALALLGPNIFAITEKLTALDLSDPKKETPYLVQGPFSHVPCQVVVCANDPANAAIMLTCSRGYAQDMVHGILEAGAQFGLRPAGETVLQAYLSA